MPKLDKAMKDAGLTGEAKTEPAKVGHNGVGDKGAGYVQRIENVHAELEKEKSAYMLKCKALREDIKEILTEAKGNGIAKGAVKGVVKARDLERKADAIREDLEPDMQDTYDTIRLALGDFADTDLGAAALSRTQAGAEVLDGLTSH